ncbi:ABC transporter permease [Microlunatus soli]|uniref:ABC-type transport system involved in multi-copper enzyme maturation, permease component n=1 Tax=Microlunatus soli TaxID=630515 RepID=A0A1H1VR80_9ACTN|nr:ABC transporter permease [Microlunatus soli]SDS87263.1 ABC-type transport system involved in multi-copper enzyme maturation, permease component [Microlunatus soli]
MSIETLDSRPAGTPGYLQRLLRSEYQKITSTRMVIVLSCIVAAAGIVGALIMNGIGLAVAAEGQKVFTQQRFVAAAYTFANQMSRIVAIIAGAMAMGAEYRHKTLAASYLAVPRRRDLVLGKAAVTFGYGLALGIVATGLSFVVSMIFILSQGGSLALDSAATWQALLMNVVTIALWSMIGYGLGLLVRQMIASVVIAVVFCYVLEPTLSLIFTVKQWTVPGRLLPGGATDTAIGISPMDLIRGHVPTDGPAAWTGLLVLLGWALLPAVIGYVSTVRRDVD